MLWIAPSEKDTDNAALVFSLSASDGARAWERCRSPQLANDRGTSESRSSKSEVGTSGPFDIPPRRAVHGLEGEIKHGGNINSYYDDLHDATGRFPFGLPRTDTANYPWIQLFHSAFNENGRAGFVMANSASNARSSEQELPRQIIETRAVDVIVAVTLPFRI